MLDRGDATCGDFLREAPDNAGEQRRSGRVPGRQVCLDAERRDVVEPGLLENRPEAGADGGRRARGAEGPVDPVAGLGHQADRRFGAHRADVEIERDKQTARAEVLEMVANGHHRIREVEEHEPADNRIEGFVGTPAEDVAFNERDMMLSRRLDPPACDRQRLRRAIESDHLPGGTDQLSRQARDMAESGAEVEDAQAGTDAGGLQEKLRRRTDQCRLPIQPGQLDVVAAEHISVSACLWLRLHVPLLRKTVVGMTHVQPGRGAARDTPRRPH